MKKRIGSALVFIGVFISAVSVFAQRRHFRGLEIVNAEYSSGSRSCDATYEVARSCNGSESCFISANNNLCGDPHFRVRKVLYVDYKCYGQRYTISIPEHQTQEISCVSRGITVDYATYRGRYNSCDATYAVADQCDGRDYCDVYASNNLCGDPEFRTVKDLEITYYCGRHRKSVFTRENSYARLSCY